MADGASHHHHARTTCTGGDRDDRREIAASIDQAARGEPATTRAVVDSASGGPGPERPWP